MAHPSDASASHDVAVVVGRWHIVHKGHETLFKAALALAGTVVIVIGSAFRSRDARNPFTWQERAKMIESTLTAQERARVRFLPVRDYHDDSRWNAAVREGMREHAQARQSVVLVGFRKDWTSDYLHHMGWTLHSVEQAHCIDATELRRVYFESGDMPSALAVIEPFVSPGVLAYLDAWSRLDVFRQRSLEHRAVQAYRAKYTAGSYNTADALVRVGDHVLLVKRASEFGNGLWALPGGFLEPNERFLTAAMRELEEETHFPLPRFALLSALQGGPALFDSPLRSARGRLVTNAYYFRFGHMPALPEVHGCDDAKEARWFHIDTLADMEESLFEDHYTILDHYLALTAQISRVGNRVLPA